MVERNDMRKNVNYSKKYNTDLNNEDVTKSDFKKEDYETKTFFQTDFKEKIEEVSEEIKEEIDKIANKFGFVNIAQHNAKALNLRKQTNTNDEPIKSLNDGARVEIIEDLGDWYHVSTEDGASGYVMSSYIKLD